MICMLSFGMLCLSALLCEGNLELSTCVVCHVVLLNIVVMSGDMFCCSKVCQCLVLCGLNF